MTPTQERGLRLYNSIHAKMRLIEEKIQTQEERGISSLSEVLKYNALTDRLEHIEKLYGL